MLLDWRQLHRSETRASLVIDPRRRLRIGLAGFALALLVVLGRAVQLEVSQGAAFRAEAIGPLRRQTDLPGVRGRILARDGTILACDKKVLALTVHYRWLQDPPDRAWLRQTARKRIPRSQRRDAQRLAEEQSRLREEQAETAIRLAKWCGLSAQEWKAAARKVQARVERIAADANRRRPEAAPLVTVAEELAYHVMAEDVPLALVAEIEGHPERYPGVRILERTRRAYRCGALAAHVLGHLGPAEGSEPRGRDPEGEETPATRDDEKPDDLVGRMGVERQWEHLLRGRRGAAVELTDHGGHLLSAHRDREPGIGRDLVLTLDARLQRTAEELLDSALDRRAIAEERPEPAGGAVVVMDVNSGELVAAASAPRFDPEVFVGSNDARRAAVLADPAHPLFDRVCRMALPPGSVFKTLTAIALLETGKIDPHKPLACQGYLKDPEHQRCAIYVRHGIGHGDVTLADALARSCNVYFFHLAGHLGPAALVDWATRMELGRTTGADLPDEAAGVVPTPETMQKLEGRAWQTSDTQAMAVGQGSLTATPLQVARLMAAVGNGGKLVTPHVVARAGFQNGPPEDGKLETCPTEDPVHIPQPQPVSGLHPSTLAAVREGLQRVVADPQGTAHAAVYLESEAIAGKTGTAVTGEGHADHAWFAGYVPAERPKFAIVVALEHSGDAATAAGPVVKRLVLRMQQLGLL